MGGGGEGQVEMCRHIIILVHSLTLILKSLRLSMGYKVNVLVFSITFVQIIFYSMKYFKS